MISGKIKVNSILEAKFGAMSWRNKIFTGKQKL